MKRWLWFGAATVLLGGALGAFLSAIEGFPAGSPPLRTDFGHPNLQGVWRVQNTAHFDLQDHAGAYGIPAGFGVVVDPPDGSIPYQDWARAKKAENFKQRETEDPYSKCYLAGVPRTMYLPHALQILQTDEEVAILSEYVHTTRWIPLTALDRYPGYESWMGDSRGRWDGDTLVVETVGFNGRTWFDHSGNFHSEALKVTERLTRTAPDVITYEARIEDPKVFTRPWTIRMPLQRTTDRSRLLEHECYLYAEDVGLRVVGSHPEGN